MQAKEKFQAVDVHQLRARLGQQCSPDAGKSAYVMGPDITGRICHVASCHSMAEAIAYAKKLNNQA